MEATKKNVINVSSDTGLSPTTIRSYLDGAPVHRSTEKLLEVWAKEHSTTSAEKAAG